MKTIKRYFTERNFYLAAFFGFFLFNFVIVLTTAFSQTGETPPVVYDALPPWIYYIVVVVGMFLHWLKGYSKDTIPMNWGDWLLTNVGATIMAIIGAFVQLGVFYTANPSVLAPISFSGIYLVLSMSYMADSVLNSSATKTVAPKTP